MIESSESIFKLIFKDILGLFYIKTVLINPNRKITFNQFINLLFYFYVQIFDIYQLYNTIFHNLKHFFLLLQLITYYTHMHLKI